jgi:O-antigen/teichoic acid export membrane protein
MTQEKSIIKSRSERSVRNAVFTFGGHVVTILLQFVNRKVFVSLLDAEYLGLNGLFSNILSLLALSELGVGMAMTYALYKPIADNDIPRIKSLMKLYKKVYSVIGFFVLAAGALLTPILHLLIKDMPDIPYIRIYYLLYVLNSGMTYFYAYKKTAIICNQDAYITSISTTIASIATKLLQIIVLWLTGSFFAYLIIQVVITRLENIVISKIADKHYPYLKDKNVEELSPEDKKDIKTNVMAMLCHKIGDVIVNATDNIILSKVLGLVSVGAFSNYILLFDNVKAISFGVIRSTSASVGNYIAKKDKEETYKVYKNLIFVNFWIIGFCSICLVCLIQDFIKIWLGDAYLLDFGTVMVLGACFYFTGMRLVNLVFKEAAGFFRQDRYKALFEAVLNLVISIPLTIHMGIVGVKLGTLISTLLVPFWIEGLVVYKHLFQKSLSRYLLLQAGYAALTATMTAVTWFACSMLPLKGLLHFVIEAGACCILPNALIAILFFRSDEFIFFRNILLNRLKRRKNK